jgi:hypothetical protein
MLSLGQKTDPQVRLLAVPLNLVITDALESRLAKKAQAAGIDASTLATRILEAAAEQPTYEEMLAEIRRKFVLSGLTEEEVSDRYEEEKHAQRATRRGRPFDE